jgi:hypothetical protein
VKRLKGTAGCRLRICHWRVAFIENARSITVVASVIANLRPRGKHHERSLAAKARKADEDLGTARLVARSRKEIAAGMPLIPQEVVDRIAGGENALSVLRKWRGKTQLHISLKTNIGQGYISDLEKGRRKGTSAALKKIADVLKVPLDLIV